MNFATAHDPSVLAPFIDAYFAMLEPLWKGRTYKIAEYIAQGLYPGSLIGEPLVTATKAWLASAPDIPALRRIVEENLAGVERALKVQAQDV
jgi:aminopeptidase N